jgi:hypothetical protein
MSSTSRIFFRLLVLFEAELEEEEEEEEEGEDNDLH